jgi:hypothetical protein
MTGRVHLGWATIDGVPAARSPFGEYLALAGFAPLGAGFRLIGVAAGAPEPEDLADATTFA